MLNNALNPNNSLLPQVLEPFLLANRRFIPQHNPSDPNNPNRKIDLRSKFADFKYNFGNLVKRADSLLQMKSVLPGPQSAITNPNKEEIVEESHLSDETNNVQNVNMDHMPLVPPREESLPSYPDKIEEFAPNIDHVDHPQENIDQDFLNLVQEVDDLHHEEDNYKFDPDFTEDFSSLVEPRMENTKHKESFDVVLPDDGTKINYPISAEAAKITKALFSARNSAFQSFDSNQKPNMDSNFITDKEAASYFEIEPALDHPDLPENANSYYHEGESSLNLPSHENNSSSYQIKQPSTSYESFLENNAAFHQTELSSMNLPSVDGNFSTFQKTEKDEMNLLYLEDNSDSFLPIQEPASKPTFLARNPATFFPIQEPGSKSPYFSENSANLPSTHDPGLNSPSFAKNIASFDNTAVPNMPQPATEQHFATLLSAGEASMTGLLPAEASPGPFLPAGGDQASSVWSSRR